MNIMNCGIYKIEAPSGHFYIGSSKNIKQRWAEHKSTLKNKKHCNPVLQRTWSKYEGNLIFSVVLVCEEKDLLFYEQLLIDNLNPDYNIAKIAGSRVNVPCSEATKQKMRMINKGKRPPSWAGKKHRLETKQKMSDSSKKRQRNDKGYFI